MYEIYSYGNIDALAGLFNAITAVMGGQVFMNAIALVFVVGFFGAFLAGALAPDRLVGPKWLMSVVLIYVVLFVPKATVQIVDKTGTTGPAVIDNVPLGLAAQAGIVSSVGNALTDLFETAFQVLPTRALPATINFSNNGLMFGAELIRTTNGAMFTDSTFKADVVSFIQNCTFYDISQGAINADDFATSNDVWALMADTNPARFVHMQSMMPPSLVTCTAAYAYLDTRMPMQTQSLAEKIGLSLFPNLQLNNPVTLPGPAAAAALYGSLADAYTVARIDSAAADTATALRQAALANSVKYAGLLQSQASNDPAAMMLGIGEAQATRQLNAQQLIEGQMGRKALPLIRNGVEAVLYACFPFVLLLVLIFGGLQAVQMLKYYALGLAWIAMWPPIYAVVNYMSMMVWAKNSAAAAHVSAGTQVLALQTVDSLTTVAAAELGVIGKLVLAVPIIASAIVFGMNKMVNFAMGYTSAVAGAAGAGAGSAATGNAQAGNVSMDQHNVSPMRTDPFTSRHVDSSGTYTYRAGEMAAFQQNIGSNAVRLGTSSEEAQRFGEASATSQAFSQEQSKQADSALERSFQNALSSSIGQGTGTQGSAGFSARESAGYDRQFQEVYNASEQLKKDLGLSDSSVAQRVLGLGLGGGTGKAMPVVQADLSYQGRHVSDSQIRSAIDKATTTAHQAGVSTTDKLMHDYVKSSDFRHLASTNQEEASRIEAGLRESDGFRTSAGAAFRQSEEYRQTAENLKASALRGEVDWTPEFNKYLYEHHAIGPGKNNLNAAEATAWANRFFNEAGVGVAADGSPSMLTFDGAGPSQVTVTPGSYRDVEAMRERALAAMPSGTSRLHAAHAGDQARVAGRGIGAAPDVPVNETQLREQFEAQREKADTTIATGEKAATLQTQILENTLADTENNASPAHALDGSLARKLMGTERGPAVEAKTEAQRIRDSNRN